MASARHTPRINDKAIVEAFPDAFMGLLLKDPEALTAQRGDRSDVFFLHLAQAGGFQRLLKHLLPARSLVHSFDAVTNHDDRAALVCAFRALAVAANDFVAVGDEDGWIILPPTCLIQDWALQDLRLNAAEEKEGVLFFSSLQQPA